MASFLFLEMKKSGRLGRPLLKILIGLVGKTPEIPRKAPLGKYQIIVYNPLAQEEKFCGDYDNHNRAAEIAKRKSYEERTNAFIYDHDGYCVNSFLYFKH